MIGGGISASKLYTGSVALADIGLASDVSLTVALTVREIANSVVIAYTGHTGVHLYQPHTDQHSTIGTDTYLDQGNGAAVVWDDSTTAPEALYVGGSFDKIGGISANNVAKWDGSSWSSLGSGMDGFIVGGVGTLVWDAGSGTLYAGGRFKTAGGVRVNHVAKWDGSTWSSLSSGTSSRVHVLKWDTGSGTLYAGGEFTTAGGVSANRVAKWDGSAWSALGSGVDSVVFAMELDVSRGVLYVGGQFTTAGGFPANKVAKWDGSMWSALASGLDGPGGSIYVKMLVWNSVSNILYASGTFTAAGSTTITNQLAEWDGSTWADMSPPKPCHWLAWDGAEDTLHCFAYYHHLAPSAFKRKNQAWSNSNGHLGSLTGGVMAVKRVPCTAGYLSNSDTVSLPL